jgi:hypothetical protein
MRGRTIFVREDREGGESRNGRREVERERRDSRRDRDDRGSRSRRDDHRRDVRRDDRRDERNRRDDGRSEKTAYVSNVSFAAINV